MSVINRQHTAWGNAFVTGVFLLLCLIAGVITFCTQSASAAPGRINYQGRLTDTSGAAKPDGSYNMKFRLYSAASSGTLLWTETRETTLRVVVTGGQFNVQLGAVTPIPSSVFSTDSVYFEVELPTPATATCSTSGCGTYTEGPMTPRQPVSSSAYALNSDTLDGLDSTSFGRLGSANVFTGINTFQNDMDVTGSFIMSNDTNIALNVTSSATQTSVFNVDTFSSVVEVGTPSVGTTFRVYGNTEFQNSTNSTSSFVVRNSTAGKLFNVDTTNSRIQVGDAAADGTGVVLVLDAKNTAGDPTGTNGAMYYNSNLSKMRCYEASAWKDCIGSSSGTGGPIVSVLSGDVSTTGTGFTTNWLEMPVKAGVTTRFTALFHYTSSATTNGSKWSLHAGTAPTMLSYTTVNTTTATTSTTNNASTFIASGIVASASSLLTGNIARIDGVVQLPADDIIRFQFAAEVSGATITTKAGSTVTYW